MNTFDRHAMGWLLSGLALTVAPHLLRLPWWIACAVIGLGAWRYAASSRGWPPPNRLLRFCGTAAILIGVFLSFGTLLGREAGIALLVTMTALKLLEIRQGRDLIVLFLLAYFVLVTHFLYTQSIPMTVYILLCAWWLLTLHIRASQRPARPMPESLRTAGVLMLQAVPLMVALFILFPRIPGPLWSMPSDAYSAMTGLSDSMSPGQISNLTQSERIAFRVKFEDEAPPPEQRYWRGPVLWDTDGQSWFNQPTPAERAWTPPQLTGDQTLRYSVTLEPHNRRWLLALDLPIDIPGDAHRTGDFQLLATKPVRERRRYDMASYTRYTMTELPRQQRQRALKLPADRNPRAVALGRELRARYHDDQAIIAAALALYRDQPFVYTLSPPRLTSPHPTDQFLFQSRRGFCEHYAGSFTVLLRAAAIPTRVVTGYQGGERNPMDGFYLVRQRDAHAWVEAWLDGQGWVRLDPTAAVAPDRIERSIQLSDFGEGAPIRFQLSESGWLTHGLRQLRYTLDAVNNGWNQWVLGYGPQLQKHFLEKWGLNADSWVNVASTLFLTLSLLIALVIAIMFRPRRQHRDPLQQAYTRFCRKLARRGLTRAANEAPGTYAQRVSAARPDLHDAVQRITQCYAAYRYGPRRRPEQARQLKQLVKRFRP